MSFNPNTSVEDLVVLVIDPANTRYGQIGKLCWHDWIEYGNYIVQFSNGKEEIFPDGLCKDDSPSSVRLFYRHNDTEGQKFDEKDAGPVSLLRTFNELEIKGDIYSMYRDLFGSDLIVN